MKKGKYIDIYIIIACLSHKKPKNNLQCIDELLSKISTGCDKEPREHELVHEDLVTPYKNQHF